MRRPYQITVHAAQERLYSGWYRMPADAVFGVLRAMEYDRDDPDGLATKSMTIEVEDLGGPSMHRRTPGLRRVA